MPFLISELNISKSNTRCKHSYSASAISQSNLKLKLNFVYVPCFSSQNKHNLQEPVDSFFLSARTAEKVPVSATRNKSEKNTTK